jgi:hypothetical protein
MDNVQISKSRNCSPPLTCSHRDFRSRSILLKIRDDRRPVTPVILRFIESGDSWPSQTKRSMTAWQNNLRLAIIFYGPVNRFIGKGVPKIQSSSHDQQLMLLHNQKFAPDRYKLNNEPSVTALPFWKQEEMTLDYTLWWFECHHIQGTYPEVCVKEDDSSTFYGNNVIWWTLCARPSKSGRDSSEGEAPDWRGMLEAHQISSDVVVDDGFV